MWAVTKGGHSICQPPKSFYKKGAAPSSEEVRDAVARLSNRFYDLDEGDCKRISDLIERLAARMPPDCVIVPREPTTGKNYEAGLWSRRNWEAALEDMIAAGEVKP